MHQRRSHSSLLIYRERMYSADHFWFASRISIGERIFEIDCSVMIEFNVAVIGITLSILIKAVALECAHAVNKEREQDSSLRYVSVEINGHRALLV